jgi:N-acyl-D-aspartate/D-glutamate deacylase
MYPYVASGNGLDATVPQWAQAGGVDAMIKRFHDPASRARILAEIREGHGGEWDGWKGRPPEDILIVSVLDPALTRWTGKRLSQVAAEMGKPPEEALIDLVEADRANVFVARFSMNEDDLQYAMRRPGSPSTSMRAASRSMDRSGRASTIRAPWGRCRA